MKMNEVIKRIASKTGVTQKATSAVLHHFKDIVLDAIADNERISWNGFFTINYYTRKVSYREGDKLIKYDKKKVKLSLAKAWRNNVMQ